MKCIDIFLACNSKNSNNDCHEFEMYSRSLTNTLGKFGIKIDLVLSANKHDERIESSDYFIMFLKDEIDELTIEEFKMAYDFKNKNGKPQIICFHRYDFRDNQQLSIFLSDLHNKYHIDDNVYVNIEDVKLELLARIIRDTDIKDELIFKDNYVYIDKNIIERLDLKLIPVYRDNHLIKQKIRKINKINDELNKFNSDVYVKLENIENREEFFALKKIRKDLFYDLRRQEKHITKVYQNLIDFKVDFNNIDEDLLSLVEKILIGEFKEADILIKSLIETTNSPNLKTIKLYELAIDLQRLKAVNKSNTKQIIETYEKIVEYYKNEKDKAILIEYLEFIEIVGRSKQYLIFADELYQTYAKLFENQNYSICFQYYRVIKVNIKIHLENKDFKHVEDYLNSFKKLINFLKTNKFKYSNQMQYLYTEFKLKYCELVEDDLHYLDCANESLVAIESFKLDNQSIALKLKRKLDIQKWYMLHIRIVSAYFEYLEYNSLLKDMDFSNFDKQELQKIHITELIYHSALNAYFGNLIEAKDSTDSLRKNLISFLIKDIDSDISYVNYYVVDTLLCKFMLRDKNDFDKMYDYLLELFKTFNKNNIDNNLYSLVITLYLTIYFNFRRYEKYKIKVENFYNVIYNLRHLSIKKIDAILIELVVRSLNLYVSNHITVDKLPKATKFYERVMRKFKKEMHNDLLVYYTNFDFYTAMVDYFSDLEDKSLIKMAEESIRLYDNYTFLFTGSVKLSLFDAETYLSRAYYKQGRYKEAKDMCLRGIEFYQDLLNKEYFAKRICDKFFVDIDIISLRKCLANCYLLEQNNDGAINEYLEIENTELADNYKGKYDQDIAKNANELMDLSLNIDDYFKYEDTITKIKNIIEKGPESVTGLVLFGTISFNKLYSKAKVALEDDDSDLALFYYRCLYKVTSEFPLFEDKKIELIQCYYEISNLYEKYELYDEAIDVLYRAVKLLFDQQKQNVSNIEDDLAKKIIDKLINILLKTKRYKETIDGFKLYFKYYNAKITMSEKEHYELYCNVVKMTDVQILSGYYKDCIRSCNTIINYYKMYVQDKAYDSIDLRLSLAKNYYNQALAAEKIYDMDTMMESINNAIEVFDYLMKVDADKYQKYYDKLLSLKLDIV